MSYYYNFTSETNNETAPVEIPRAKKTITPQPSPEAKITPLELPKPFRAVSEETSEATEVDSSSYILTFRPARKRGPVTDFITNTLPYTFALSYDCNDYTLSLSGIPSNIGSLTVQIGYKRCGKCKCCRKQVSVVQGATSLSFSTPCITGKKVKITISS